MVSQKSHVVVGIKCDDCTLQYFIHWWWTSEHQLSSRWNHKIYGEHTCIRTTDWNKCNIWDWINEHKDNGMCQEALAFDYKESENVGEGERWEVKKRNQNIRNRFAILLYFPVQNPTLLDDVDTIISATRNKQQIQIEMMRNAATHKQNHLLWLPTCYIYGIYYVFLLFCESYPLTANVRWLQNATEGII